MYMEIRKTVIFIMPFSCSCGLFAGRVARLFKPDSRPGIQLLSYVPSQLHIPMRRIYEEMFLQMVARHVESCWIANTYNQSRIELRPGK